MQEREAGIRITMFMSNVSSADSASESSLTAILVPVAIVAVVAGLCAAFTHLVAFIPRRR